METFDIEVKEVLSKVVKVEAKSIGDAITEVRGLYEKGTIKLTKDDVVFTDYSYNQLSKDLNKKNHKKV